MDKVEFEETNFDMPPRKTKSGLLNNFLIKTGIAKDDGQASVILLLCLTVCFILSAIIFAKVYSANRETPHQRPLPAQYSK
jgi:hypothetical protein